MQILITIYNINNRFFLTAIFVLVTKTYDNIMVFLIKLKIFKKLIFLNKIF